MPFFDNLVETIEDCMGMLSRVEGIESTLPGLILHVGPQIDQTWSAASDRAVNTINRGRQTSENFFNKLNRKWTLLYRAILEIHGYIEQKMEYIDRTWKQATTLFEALDKKSRKWCAREYRAVFREMKKALSKAKKRVDLVRVAVGEMVEEREPLTPKELKKWRASMLQPLVAVLPEIDKAESDTRALRVAFNSLQLRTQNSVERVGDMYSATSEGLTGCG